MTNLTIEYHAKTREAVLRIADDASGWPQIRRACTDASDQIRGLDARSLAMPWWAFLGAREAIGYHVRRNDLKVHFSHDAQTLLKQARDREATYKAPTSVPRLDANGVVKRLSKIGFERKLTKHQLRNVVRLLPLPAGANFSVPGAGKTTEALAYYFCKRGTESRLLVICPKNAFAVWEEQIGQCLPHMTLSVKRLTGGDRQIAEILDSDPDIALISYQQVPYVVSRLAEYLLRNSVYVLVDESHHMKRGTEGVIGNAILSIAHLDQGKLIMSGTPLPNALSDLVPQFCFLYPEVRADADSVTTLVKPVSVRTTKSELDLPPIDRRLILIELNETQRYLYELLCSEFARQSEGLLTAADRIKLRTLGHSALKLIQLVSNPPLLALTGFAQEDLLAAVLAEGDSPKLQYVVARARQLAREGRKTILWSSFVANVELIATRLSDLGAQFIHGGVEAGSVEEENTREAKIRRFHDDPNCWVLVANPAACGESISLHQVCHHAIYLDRIYNAGQYLQSEDRIHRLGLPEGTHTVVEIVCCPGTVDESVARRLTAKVKRMGEVLDDENLNIDPIPFDPEDMGIDWDDARDFIEHVREVASRE